MQRKKKYKTDSGFFFCIDFERRENDDEKKDHANKRNTHEFLNRLNCMFVGTCIFYSIYE